MSQSNLQTEVASATADKWPVKVHAAGRGQWGFVAGPRSGTGYQSKQAALEAGEAARLAAIARASARTSDQARARWAAEYREARKVRGFTHAFGDVFQARLGYRLTHLADLIPGRAFRAAWGSMDRLSFPSDKAFPDFKRKANGPRGRLPA